MWHAVEVKSEMLIGIIFNILCQNDDIQHDANKLHVNVFLVFLPVRAGLSHSSVIVTN